MASPGGHLGRRVMKDAKFSSPTPLLQYGSGGRMGTSLHFCHFLQSSSSGSPVTWATQQEVGALAVEGGKWVFLLCPLMPQPLSAGSPMWEAAMWAIGDTETPIAGGG